MKKINQPSHNPVKLWSELTGKKYIPSWHTSIRHTFYRSFGWIGPEERKRNNGQ